MRINYNSQAMNANNALTKSDNLVAQSIRRLSSGLKVSSAEDDPSGYAISKRMNIQIEGLSNAKQNANNGISVIETADGAMSEEPPRASAGFPPDPKAWCLTVTGVWRTTGKVPTQTF